ncbi:MAG: site-specific integrase [Kiritimatiellae bacterium]|nr:site-specific integrase [Kiritimatiellia bacterium]
MWELRSRRGSLRRERSGNWTMRVQVNGKTYRRAAGTQNREAAERSLEQFVVEMESRHKKILETVPLFKEWKRFECSADAARLSPFTRKMKYGVWLNFTVWLREAHPEITVAEGVTRRVAEEYLAFYQSNHAGMTCNLRIYTLRAIFRTLLGDRGIEDNPWKNIPPRAHDGHTRRELSVDEVRRLMAAAGAEGPEWRLLFLLAVCTGLRLGDCCRLTWEHVDLQHGIIQLIPAKTKRYSGGRPVTIPIHRQLQDAFLAVPSLERSGAVFPGIALLHAQRRWILSRTLSKIFSDARIETSVYLDGRKRATPEATFHSLRHSFVSFAANAGVPLVVVQSIVGHTSTSMTRHYYHANEAALREAVSAVPTFGPDGTVTPGFAPVKGRAGNGFALPARRHTAAFRLGQLEKMRVKGLITADEYQNLRQTILAQV